MKHTFVGIISALFLFSVIGPSDADGINKTLVNPNPDRTVDKAGWRDFLVCQELHCGDFNK